MRESYDLVVVGGGPGGYPAAIRASQLGLRVTLVEKRELGGECTNYGCVPMRALARAIEAYTFLSAAPFARTGGLSFPELMEWVRGIRGRVSGGLEGLLEKYGIEIIRSEAFFDAEGVETQEGRIRAKKILIATGTEPAVPSGLELGGPLMTTRELFELSERPASMIILGGDYIGVSLAEAFARLGSSVTIVEPSGRFLAEMDEDIVRLAQRRLSKMGVKVLFSAIKGVEKRERLVSLSLAGGEQIEAEAAVVNLGRKPNTEGLWRLGVRLDERGFVIVAEDMRTSNPSVFAAGDVTGPPLLANKALAQSIVAGEAAAGKRPYYDPRAVPMVMFGPIDFVSVGITEAEAKAKGYEALSVKLPLGGLARTLIDEQEGLAKIVYEARSGALLGVHLAGPGASEVAGEAALAIEMGATLEDLASSLHAHPTMSEALLEAAELALGRPKHFFQKTRV